MVLPYSQNDLVFRFAAPYFIDEEATQFSYFLEGFDQTEWSAWTTESKKEYTNLREGTYVFKVKARNIFGKESNVASYQFTILPPWYRTWWAYSLYALLGILLILGLIYGNSRRLLAAKRRLEATVKQRTAEIEKQKAEIEAQRDNLAEMNEEINMQREEILITAENLKIANNEISKKNEDIVASINYAQRIQFAMLPFEGRIAENIGKENFFILYKPKDIVSGDFYVFEEIDNKLFVAVADCTGHGVPGAFMSMIGNQLLHEIIVRDAVHRPDLVLNKLHLEIRRVLQQEQTGTQDGMDIALVVIYRQEAYFEYAGAMNPMYYLQGEQPTLHELKATKKPIGGRTFDKEAERVFAYHTVQFDQTPTTLYLFSDGYCDQFGGQDNRKFMAKRFRETLLAAYNKPLAQQKQILDDTITTWIKEANEKQIDDILVVGIKVV
jgi:serine phosphatase RsbU (regulator of sigma subunit)